MLDSPVHLVLILAVLVALGVAESGPPEPVSGVSSRIALAAAAAAFVVLFAAVSSGVVARALRRDVERRQRTLRLFQHLRRLHAFLLLAVVAGVTYGLEWGRLVRFNWHLDRSFLLDDLLILAPVVVPLVLSWAAFYRVDRMLLAGAGDEAEPASAAVGLGRYLALHARHYLGVLLLPVLAILAVQDAIGLVAPQIAQHGWAACLAVPPLAVIMAAFPVLLRHVWQTQPLPEGALRRQLLATAVCEEVRIREILVWHTSGMMVNAAVAGFLPWLRYVFLSDGLLCRLTGDEVRAVFAHEIAHLRHRHVRLRVLVMVAPLCLGLAAGQVFPQTAESLALWAGADSAGGAVPAALLALAAMALYIVSVFGVCSRLWEHQADLCACRALVASGGSDPMQTFVSALEKLADANGASRTARGWQHASIARRIDFVQRTFGDADRALRFERRLRLLGRVVVGAAVSPLACLLLFG